MERPQINFKTPVDNSSSPFVPRLKQKPNSLKPLKILPEYDDDGNIDSYKHPYDFELNKFKPDELQLIQVHPQQPNDIEETPLIYVDNNSGLNAMITALNDVKEIAVDVEHHSERTFQGITCLLQLSTRTHDYIVDTLVLRDELDVLNEIFTHPKIVKVFHGAESDVKWLQRDLSVYIVNMFDTQEAAKCLGQGNVSLANLLKKYCKIEADKSYQLADWRIRPLRAEHLQYARQDTHYLLYIYDTLRNELLTKGKGKSKFLRKAYHLSTNVCRKRYAKLKFTPISHLKLYYKMYRNQFPDNQQSFALKQLFTWRDKVARTKDESCHYVLPDTCLLRIAKTLPRGTQGILECCNSMESLPFLHQYLNDLRELILKALELPLTETKGYNEVNEEIKTIARQKKPPKDLLLKFSLHVTQLNQQSTRSSKTKYIDIQRKMLYLEEEEQILFLQKFNLKDLKLTFVSDDEYYFSVDPTSHQCLELLAAIKENFVDWFVLTSQSLNKRDKIWGEIDGSFGEKVYISILRQSIGSLKKSYENEIYDIHFQLNRTTFECQHVALNCIKKKNLFPILLDDSKYASQTKYLKNENFFELTKDAKSLENLNTEQKSAVQNIVNGKNRPLPYLLYGPPGTGKTLTLVAAIEQIVLKTRKNILVCAMSNAACDEIADRLLNVLESDQIFRYSAISRKLSGLNTRLKSISNYADEDGFYSPSKEELLKYRVLVCTLTISGVLERLRFDEIRHFQYIFIDECASAHETMTLMPIAGVCTLKNQLFANIILTGDPKQLPAITKSKWARKLGYQISWMEHLFNQNLYKRDERGKLNEVYITQLVNNYRSHTTILKIPNELFYEKTLQAKATKDITDWYINSKILPNKNFPFIFISVQGRCANKIDFSLFNANEVDAVYTYIKKVLLTKLKGLNKITQSDIGVVSPYRVQCQKIRQKLARHCYDEITVGTAEAFQGKEKPVMIISTVRSGLKTLGFVSDPQRLNVMITRAKCLLIIIGDPHTLKMDDNWLRIMKYCSEHNSFIQNQQHKFQF